MPVLSVFGIFIPLSSRSQAHNSIPYQAASAPVTPMNMYAYPMNMYPMYPQPSMYQMALESFSGVSQAEPQEKKEVVVPMPVASTRKKGESLAHAVRKMSDGRPYPVDYATNSLK